MLLQDSQRGTRYTMHQGDDDARTDSSGWCLLEEAVGIIRRWLRDSVLDSTEENIVRYNNSWRYDWTMGLTRNAVTLYG